MKTNFIYYILIIILTILISWNIYMKYRNIIFSYKYKKELIEEIPNLILKPNYNLSGPRGDYWFLTTKDNKKGGLDTTINFNSTTDDYYAIFWDKRSDSLSFIDNIFWGDVLITNQINKENTKLDSIIIEKIKDKIK